MSLPSRERGLKQTSSGIKQEIDYVAPFTGAWIETLISAIIGGFVPVAPFTGAWIETQQRAKKPFAFAGRSLHGSVD